MAKSKLCLTTIACLSIALPSTTVFAGSLMADPVYFGARSVNPEKETYAYPGHVEKGERICFIGPARIVGPLARDAEKDTIAYQALLVGQEASLRSAEPSQ